MASYVEIPTGSVEYSRESAAIEIDQFIQLLLELQEDGATHVVGLSGNYRGAQYVRLGTPDFAEDDDDDPDYDDDDDDDEE